MCSLKEYIVLDGISKEFSGKRIIQDESMSIFPGECIYIEDENGKGKTVLLKIISGIIKKDSGRIIYRKNLKISYLPQENLYPENTQIRDYFEMYLSFYKQYYKQNNINKIVNEYMLNESLKNTFEQISGGTKRKALLIACLLVDVDLYILDEPLTGLDEKSKSVVIGHLEKKISEGKSILITSHDDSNKIKSISTSVLRINKRGDV